MMKVLALGYIPKWKGGRQMTGLATGLFDLHDAVNSLNSDVRVVIAATDVFQEEVFIDHTKVLGWKKGLLLRHAIKRFYRLPLFLKGAIALNKYSKVTGGFASIFAKILYLDYAIERERPDIIHLHGCIYATFIDYLWQKNIPVILRIHGVNGYDPAISGYLHYREMEKKITGGGYKCVTFVSNHILNEWESHYGKFKCHMIPIINGYNADVFYPPLKKVDPVYDLVTISGLSERKGQDRVLKALFELKKDNKDFKYLIVGNGIEEYEKQIKQYAKDKDLDVIFIDYCSQNNLKEYMWQSKFFILPSSSEGFGKVFVESIACGLPVILPKTLPIAHEVGLLNESNCIFSEDSSSESIKKVLSALPETWISVKKVSETVEHLAWRNIALQYVNIYIEFMH